MLYAILGEDVPDSLPLRKSVRPEHLARLEQLASQNRLVLAGPHPIATDANLADSGANGEAGFSGSLIVAEFTTLAEAQAWAEADPYVSAGVFRQVTVKPFKKVLP